MIISPFTFGRAAPRLRLSSSVKALLLLFVPDFQRPGVFGGQFQ
jgi:hypothetical protein